MKSPLTCAFVAGLLLSASSGALGSGAHYSRLLPTDEPANPIGFYSNGCLRGGQAADQKNPYYQIIRPQNRRYFGSPRLLSFINYLGQEAHTQKLPILLIGDMSMGRGGPFNGGPASHQNGLDADIWFRMTKKPLSRQALEKPQALTIVSDSYKTVNQYYTPKIYTLVKLAALHPDVERIFINAAIKVQLCHDAPKDDRAWLQKVRPWPGHTAHMHVRLSCPLDSTSCTPQNPVLPGDGCQEAQQIIAEIGKPKPITPVTPKPKKVLPMECQLLLNPNIKSAPNAQHVTTIKK